MIIFKPRKVIKSVKNTFHRAGVQVSFLFKMVSLIYSPMNGFLVRQQGAEIFRSRLYVPRARVPESGIFQLCNHIRWRKCWRKGAKGREAAVREK